MKPAEFYEIMIRFVDEQKRWKSLNIGDIIYDAQCRYGDIDYHKMKILEIDIDERTIKAHDVTGNHQDTLHGFLTEEEFKKV